MRWEYNSVFKEWWLIKGPDLVAWITKRGELQLSGKMESIQLSAAEPTSEYLAIAMAIVRLEL